MIFREAELKDKEFILNANKEINALSGLEFSSFEKRIDKDLFEDKIFKSIVAEKDNIVVGMILYSYVYFANFGKGIYLSQAYVKDEYRGQGIYKELLKELERREMDCNYISDFVGKDNIVMQKALDRLNFVSTDLTVCYRMIDR